jgi:hypothetical protein
MRLVKFLKRASHSLMLVKAGWCATFFKMTFVISIYDKMAPLVVTKSAFFIFYLKG